MIREESKWLIFWINRGIKSLLQSLYRPKYYFLDINYQRKRRYRMIWKKWEGKIGGFKAESMNLQRKIRVFHQLYLSWRKCFREIRKGINNSQVPKSKNNTREEIKRRKRRRSIALSQEVKLAWKSSRRLLGSWLENYTPLKLKFNQEIILINRRLLNNLSLTLFANRTSMENLWG